MANTDSSPASEFTHRARDVTLPAARMASEYLPCIGVVGAGLFNNNLMAPIIMEKAFGSRSLLGQNICFAAAHIGTAVYIYKSIPKQQKLTETRRVMIAATGGAVFNYGTLLILANIKHYLPESKLLRCIVGSGVLGYLFWIGREYLSSVKETTNEK